MSDHSYSRVWLHLVWATKDRAPLLDREARIKTSHHLNEYAREKGIYMMLNYVNADHVHALVDMPTNLTIEQILKLFKGESSHWINENRIIPGRFSWQQGYGAFSLSHSMLDKLCRYIAGQTEHHRKKTLMEEIRSMVEAYGLVWHDQDQRYYKTVETV